MCEVLLRCVEYIYLGKDGIMCFCEENKCNSGPRLLAFIPGGLLLAVAFVHIVHRVAVI